MSDPLNALKRYRAPFWSRWIGAWRARRLNKERIAQHRIGLKKKRLVATLRRWTRWTDVGGIDCNVYFLYVDGRGGRSYVHEATMPLLDGYEKRTDIYHRVIVPWLSGAGDSDDVNLKKWEDHTKARPSEKA